MDAVVIRLEAMEQNVGQSVWNRDIVIYQTVNDFSSSEIYDPVSYTHLDVSKRQVSRRIWYLKS